MTTPRARALVTGASGGIGLELAKLAAADQHDLVLVARDADKLAAIAESFERQHGIAVTIIVCDLADPDAPTRILAAVGGDGVDVLVNNAGFAAYGEFADLDLDTQLGMIDVNVRALTALSHRFATPMIRRRRGAILNVASTAAFFPGPLMTVYYATKHYVLAFSEGLAEELAPHGVTVTALCPGPTRTGFQDRAEMTSSRVFNRRAMQSGPVARAGWDGMRRGRRIVIPGVRNATQTQVARLVPRRVLARAALRAQRPAS